MCRSEDHGNPIPHDGGADPDKGVPTYRERLAHGTDQGRWLMEQVDTDAAANRRRSARPAQRVYHDVEQLLPSEAKCKKQPDSLAARQGGWSLDDSSGLPMLLARALARRDPRLYAIAAVVLVFILWMLRWLLR